MLSKKILIFGGGGHSFSVLDTLLSSDQYDEIAILDDDVERHDQSVLGFKIIGSDKDAKRLFHMGFKYAFIAIGSVGNTILRERLYQQLKMIGFYFPNIIDLSASIAKEIWMGEGIYIGKRVVVNSQARIGDCAILNSGCIVEHQCIVGSFAHIAPGAVLCGNVTVGYGAHIGANACVKQQVRVGDKAMLGLGGTLLRDLPAGETAYGCPAYKKRE